MVLAIDCGELLSILLEPQRIKAYLKFKLDEKLRLFSLLKTLYNLSPSIPKLKEDMKLCFMHY